MTGESDGLVEALEGQIRVAVTAATQVARSLARLHEEALRRASARSEREARELTSRFDAERAVARAELAGVYRDEWWEQSTPEQIGRAYQVASTWSAEDPELARAEQKMAQELRDRYDVDVSAAGASPQDVQQLIRLQSERAERDLAAAGAERTRAAEEEAEALRLMVEAHREDRAADDARAESTESALDASERLRERDAAQMHDTSASALREDGEVAYDSAERRAQTAADLESRGIDSDTVATRMRADISQGKPATDAVAVRRRAPAKARPKRNAGAERSRPGLDR